MKRSNPTTATIIAAIALVALLVVPNIYGGRGDTSGGADGYGPKRENSGGSGDGGNVFIEAAKKVHNHHVEVHEKIVEPVVKAADKARPDFLPDAQEVKDLAESAPDRPIIKPPVTPAEVAEKVHHLNKKIKDELHSHLPDNWAARQVAEEVDKAFAEALKAIQWAKIQEAFVFTQDWPEGFPHQAATRIANPSVTASLSQGMVDSMMKLLSGETITFDEEGNHLLLDSVSLGLRDESNSFQLSVVGSLRIKAYLDHSLHIKNASFDLFPYVEKVGDRTYLHMAARCVNLDIDGVPEGGDRALCHILNKLLVDAGPILSEDLTERLTLNTQLPTQGKSEVSGEVSEVVSFIEGGVLHIQASVEVSR